MRTRSRGAPRCTITLPDVGVVRGTFPPEGERPEYLSIALRDPRSWRREWRQVEARIFSDGQSFEAGGIVPGRYEVRVFPEGCVVVDYGEMEVTTAPLLLDEVSLEPAGAIEGVLVDMQSLSWARRVGIPDLDLSCAIGEGGWFRIDHVPSGSWSLRPMGWSGPGGPSLTVYVEAGETTKVEFTVSR